MLLTAVFTLLICQHHEEPAAHGIVRLTAAAPTSIDRKEETMTGNLHVGLAALGAAIGVGLIGRTRRSPSAAIPARPRKIMVQSILAIAFAEAIVFYALFLVR